MSALRIVIEDNLGRKRADNDCCSKQYLIRRLIARPYTIQLNITYFRYA